MSEQNEHIEEVDVDRLTKAISQVAESMNDTSEDEYMAKALAEAEDIVEAVTKGADALLVEFRAQNEALAKGLLALSDRVQELSAKLDNAEPMAKSLDAGAPLRKSVDVEDVETIAHPADDAINTRGDLISKAMAELSGTEDMARRSQLARVVSLVEAGADINKIRAQYSI